MINIKLCIQEAQQFPNRINSKKYIRVKMLKDKHKEKVLKTGSEK